MNMYFIAIVLPEALNEKIFRYKIFMRDTYNCFIGLKSPAHITIVPPCWMHEEMEASLQSGLDVLSGGIENFKITTNNFSAFEPRTIFVAVKENEKLLEVKDKTDAVFKEHPQFKLKCDARLFHPHITIATRDLHKKDFYLAWTSFENKKFSETWTATGLSLLRHNKKNWDVLHTSQFKNILE